LNVFKACDVHGLIIASCALNFEENFEGIEELLSVLNVRSRQFELEFRAHSRQFAPRDHATFRL
jgi:hypothetical protein